MENPAKLVLFDIDGTLLHSQGLGRKVIKKALVSTYGSEGMIDSCEVGGLSYLQIVENALAREEITKDKILQGFSSFNQQVEFSLKEITQREPEWIHPLPGGIKLVNHLSENPKIVLGLVTGNPSGASFIKLNVAGYRTELFKVNAFGDESPTREGLVTLARQRAYHEYNISFSGKHTVIVGDTRNDVDCARKSGALSIMVLTGYDKEQDIRASNPNYIFKDLSDHLAIENAIFDSM